MKFIHIADVHLGASPDEDKAWGEERSKEIWYSLQNVIDACNEKEADLLLIAGDLFHKQPLVRELKELDYIFSKLEKTQIVLMAGNHDYISPRSNYLAYDWNSRVHMFMNDQIEWIEFPELNTVVYGLSYLKRNNTNPIYDTVKPNSREQINILLAHGGDDKNVPINRDLLLSSAFDYIALGHIHKPEIISDKMAYAGSLEPLHKNELGPRGYVYGLIDPSMQRPNKISFIPIAHREYKKIILDVKPETTNLELIDKARDRIKEHGKNNIYHFTIQGFRSNLVEFDKGAIIELGNVLDLIDESLVDYDFDKLYKDNADNIIGLYIKKLKEKPVDNHLSKKALYYGIEAFIDAKSD